MRHPASQPPTTSWHDDGTPICAHCRLPAQWPISTTVPGQSDDVPVVLCHPTPERLGWSKADWPWIIGDDCWWFVTQCGHEMPCPFWMDHEGIDIDEAAMETVRPRGATVPRLVWAFLAALIIGLILGSFLGVVLR